MKWIEALKKWNEGSSKWCIPRKGTKEYEEVMAIKNGTAKPKSTSDAEPIPVPASEPAPILKVEDIIPPKTFEQEFNEYIESIVNAEGDPYEIDYSASGLITKFILIYFMEKYKNDCAVFINTGSKVNMEYEFGRTTYKDILYDAGVFFADPTIAKLFKRDVGFRISLCIHYGSKLVVIPFTLFGHMNMMIYRVKGNSIEHYEPHGATYGGPGLKARDKAVENFQSWIKEWEDEGFLPEGVKFIPTHEVCPTKGFQHFEGRDRLELKKKQLGFCQMWSLFYLEMCLKFPNVSGKELIDLATKKLQEMGMYKFAEHIVKYTRDLNNVMRKYINKDVDITSNALIRNEKLREEVKGVFEKKIEDYLSSNTEQNIEHIKQFFDAIKKKTQAIEDKIDAISKKIKKKEYSSEQEKTALELERKKLKSKLKKLDEEYNFFVDETIRAENIAYFQREKKGGGR